MIRIGIVVILLGLFSCKDKPDSESGEDESLEQFAGRFREGSIPYELSDTAFLNNRDTSAIRSVRFTSLIHDSIKADLFGKGSKIRFIPLVKFNGSEEDFFIVKSVSGRKKAALLMAFHGDSLGNVFPFLLPDSDPSTSQVSSIEENGIITRSVLQRKKGEPIREGKEVFDYDPQSKTFALVLVSPLNPDAGEIINPIDTFPATHKYSGYYAKDKKNFVSVRDGRYPNQLRFFIHIQKKNDCSGELKGDLLLTSSNTAIYREGGDPCVLSFRFTGKSVIITEDEGCGSQRGLNCVFDGTYSLKKTVRQK